jgi:hypothetical protein
VVVGDEKEYQKKEVEELMRILGNLEGWEGSWVPDLTSGRYLERMPEMRMLGFEHGDSGALQIRGRDK